MTFWCGSRTPGDTLLSLYIDGKGPRRGRKQDGKEGRARQVGGVMELPYPSVLPTLQEPPHNQLFGSFLIQSFGFLTEVSWYGQD